MAPCSYVNDATTTELGSLLLIKVSVDYRTTIKLILVVVVVVYSFMLRNSYNRLSRERLVMSCVQRAGRNENVKKVREKRSVLEKLRKRHPSILF